MCLCALNLEILACYLKLLLKARFVMLSGTVLCRATKTEMKNENVENRGLVEHE